MENQSPFFISVVVVNFNSLALLRRCLSPLVAQTYSHFEIVLVDNGSSDSSCEFVAQHFRSVRIVKSESNAGFAAGNNLGIRAARGDFIATLNTDTEVAPDYLEKLVCPMRDPSVGACAPLMLEMEQREIVDAAGLCIDRFGFAWNVGAGKRASEFAGVREIYGACAGAALYRRIMLEQMGGFDDDFFAFYEDADLAWRAHNVGWKTIFVPAARVYHQHGASFGKMAPQKTYLLARNRWWTTFKNYPLPQLAFYLPIIALLDAAALLQAARRGHLREAWRGRVDAARGSAAMLQKRES
jgi:GT2 family glycosyltransferase